MTIAAARYTITDAPTSVASDQCVLLTVRLTNTGTATWCATGTNAVTLAYHWHDRMGRPVIAEGLHVRLPNDVAPMESAAVRIAVEPPGRPGAYLLTVDLVQEGVAWFSESGCPPLQIGIAVVPPPLVERRVTIVFNDSRLNDAMGNHLVEQLRFFRERGDRVLALVEHLDEHQPDWVRALLCRVRLADLQNNSDDPLVRRAVEHFRDSNLFIFNYPTYYELIESIRLVQGGQVLFDYHCITPPQIWGDTQGLEDLIRGQQNVGLVRYADYAIAHSSYGRDELVAGSGISPNQVAVVPYVVPLDQFQPSPPDAALVERYGLAGKPVLLYIGRMAANKRIDDLIRALPLIQRHLPGTTLLLVGDTETQPYPQLVAAAQALAVELQVADHVIFTGAMPHSQLVHFFATCDLYVTASLHEGFCIPVIEAAACGKPTVGTAATALPETIGPGGITFPPGDVAALADAVVRLLATRDNRWSS